MKHSIIANLENYPEISKNTDAIVHIISTFNYPELDPQMVEQIAKIANQAYDAMEQILCTVQDNGHAYELLEENYNPAHFITELAYCAGLTEVIPWNGQWDDDFDPAGGHGLHSHE